MRKLLALSILVSTVLTGCGSGGSDSGSSSSSAPAVQKYTFEFVQMVETNNPIPANCTIFDVEGQNTDAQTYGRLASDVTVKLHNADGSFVKELDVASNGVLTFAKDSIEDGGYISIIDSPSEDDPYYKVLSIQKELLGNYLISVKRPQSSTVCYQGGKGSNIKSGVASVNLNGISAGKFSYDSSLISVPAVALNQHMVSAYANEKILVKAYSNSKLVDYAFVSEVGDDIEDTRLNGVKLEDYQWSISLPVNELSTLTIRLGDGDYSYPWYDAIFNPASGLTTNFPYMSTESSWFYSAAGTTSNWVFLQNGNLSAQLDVKLPDSLKVDTDAPAISQSGDSFVVQAVGAFSTEQTIQRSHYTHSYDNNAETLNHSIYSIVESGGEVIIPNLGLANLEPDTQDHPYVSVLETTARNTDFIESFLRHYQGQDLVSVVLTPADRITHQKAMQMSTYTLVER